MPDFKFFSRICMVLIALTLSLGLPSQILARSAFSPRHSGLEPPDSPKSLQSMPGRPITTTPDGGKGYVDAYGNAIKSPEATSTENRPRLHPGAYGHRQTPSASGPTFNNLQDNSSPMWNFR